ncbi:unnamed protein product [Aureobasidium uvarum]|uniref:Uncharacterized protein n=1 Tax=Aureobasidium uvarum TaxID=2773716 RepID=A0A9N8PSI5_9PEZI|nr:unnamed protein product [Aureobasidium uvarum]
MALKVGDILKRLGLRGAIIRYGEQWKTQEIKDLEEDIRAFYQKYEPYLKREEEYPVEFNTDINDILEKHGPGLWPDGPRSEDTTLWLFPAGDISEYLEDIYYSRHIDNNQRHAELKAKERREAELAAANASTSNHLSDSDLTDFDSHDEPPSLLHTIKFERDENRAKLQEILKGEEFNLRKRKLKTDSPMGSAKRSKQLKAPSEPVQQAYNQHVSSWTTTNPETINVASPSNLDNGHDLLVAAASGPTHGFVSVNQAEQHEQPQPVQVLDSDEDVPVLGRTTLSLHSSDDSSSNNGNHNLPDTPGEGVLHTQYSLPQDNPFDAQMTKPPQHSQVDAEPSNTTNETASSQPQVTDTFIPWPKLSKRRAKRSKNGLRPMLENDDTELPSQELPSTPSADASHPHIISQQDESFISVDGHAPESRKLMKRTHVRTPAPEPSNSTTDNTAATPNHHATQRINNLTPLSNQTRTYQTPYADAQPPVPVPHIVPSSVDTVLGATNTHPAPIDPPHVMSGQTPTTMNKHLSIDMPVSANIITSHFVNTFVKCTLTFNGRKSVKMLKLADCFDAVALHQTVNFRFKETLSGQVPSEITFIFADTDFEINTDGGAQTLWDEFIQTVLDQAPPGTCPVVATVKL